MIGLALWLVMQDPAAGGVGVPEPVAVPESAAGAPVAAPSGSVTAAPAAEGPVAESVAAPGAPAAPVVAPAAAPVDRRGFIFAWLPAVVFGISPAPSFAPATIFLGGRLPRSWALGYQFSGSFGFAERYFSGIITHRHYLVGLHGFGATRRGLTGVGGGVAFTLPLKPIAEVEARVGLRFGDTRRWAVGALVRLGWDIGHQERAPMPQFGAFFGYVPL